MHDPWRVGHGFDTQFDGAGEIDIVSNAHGEVEAPARVGGVVDECGFEDDGVWDADDVAIEGGEDGCTRVHEGDDSFVAVDEDMVAWFEWLSQ